MLFLYMWSEYIEKSQNNLQMAYETNTFTTGKEMYQINTVLVLLLAYNQHKTL